MSPRRARLARLSAQRRDQLGYAALRPLVRLLLASGVSEVQLTALLARALTAHRQEAPRGRLGTGTDAQSLLGPAATVVSAWSQDPRWLDAHGEPRPLSLSSRASDGFPALVAACAPEAQPQVVLQELQRTRTVARSARPARVRLIERAVVYAHASEFDVAALLTHVRRFHETVEYNVLDRPAGARGRFERAVHAFDLPADAFPEFERYLWQQADDLIQSGDAKLSAYRQRAGRTGRAAFGFGVYLFRDTAPSAPARRRRP